MTIAEENALIAGFAKAAGAGEMLNPKENIWDEIREKIFKNYVLKSMDEVDAKLDEAILSIEHNPGIVTDARIYERCRKTAKGEPVPDASPPTFVSSKATPGLRG